MKKKRVLPAKGGTYIRRGSELERIKNPAARASTGRVTKVEAPTAPVKEEGE